MKNYALNREDSQNFIKRYRIIGGKIIATLGTDEEYIVSYSKENEKIILSRMEKQVNNIDEIDAEIIQKCKRNAITFMLSLIIPTSLILGLLIGGGLHTFGWIMLAISIPAAVICGSRSIQAFLTSYDIEKSNYYLKNEKELNDKLKINHNMTLGMSKKGTKQLEQDARKTPAFDINVIDKYSLKDLKTLLKNIQREETFGFVEPESTSTLQYIKK